MPAPRSSTTWPASIRARPRRIFCVCAREAFAASSAARAPESSRTPGTVVAASASSSERTRPRAKSESVWRARSQPNSVCRLAPPWSRSTATARGPVCARPIARLADSTDLPTPPFPLATAQIVGPALRSARGAARGATGPDVDGMEIEHVGGVPASGGSVSERALTRAQVRARSARQRGIFRPRACRRAEARDPRA